MKPWYAFVGEAPSASTDGEPPFVGRSGSRLADLLTVPLRQLPMFFELHNLLSRHPGREGKGSAFPLEEATREARELCRAERIARHAPPYRRVLLAGHRVAEAFGISGGEYFQWVFPPPARDPQNSAANYIFAVFPHPSGINLWWNEAANARRARAFLQDCAKSSTGCPKQVSLDAWSQLLQLRREIDETDRAIVRIGPTLDQIRARAKQPAGATPADSILEALVQRRVRASWEVRMIKRHRVGMKERDLRREKEMVERWPKSEQQDIIRTLLEVSSEHGTEEQPGSPS